MRKIIVMGECTVDMIYPTVNTPSDSLNVSAQPGGRLLNAAAKLGDDGMYVTFVGDAATDPLGDFLVDFLYRHHVDTKSIDRFTDGITATNMHFPAQQKTICVRDYPSQRFDVIWPRIEANDIVVVGTFFAVDGRVRSQLMDLLSHAVERKAIIVYLPGLLPPQTVRITAVMPAIYENLELTDLIISRRSDLVSIFGEKPTEEIFTSTIDFYCPLMMDVDAEQSKLTLYASKHKSSGSLSPLDISLDANASAVAAIIKAIIDLGLTRDMLKDMTPEMASRFVAETSKFTDKYLNR